MSDNFGSKIKRRLGQILHSLANRIETERPERPKTPAANRASNRRRRRRLPPVDSSRATPTATEKRPDSNRSLLQTLHPATQVVYQNSLKIAQNVHKNPKFWFWLGLGLGASASAIAAGLAFVHLESGVPKSVDDVLTYTPPGTMTIQASDGTVLQEIGPVTHDKLKIWQIPDHVLQAFIATEDRRFQDHSGVDPQGILRAMFSNIKAGDVVEGGSTITQQLARIVFLSQERSMGRKLKEMRIAQKIEEKFDKSQILEQYLNLVYLGSGAYGLGDAAWVYFSKPVDQLTIAEVATLAGIVPAPSVYSPLENPKAAKERRDLVIRSMEKEGFIAPELAQKAIDSPLVTNPSPLKRMARKAPYFTEYIQKELPKYLSKEVLQAGGLTVETTLNSRWQSQAEAAIQRSLSTYGRWERFKQAALVSIDPRTGQIKTMVGGNDFEKNQYNRVTQAKRQPGSTFKPFVYTTAIAAGVSPNQGYMNAEYTVDGYKPENFGDKYTGNYVSMRQALASSLNVVAVKILVDVGWNPIIKIAKAMGIESELQPTYSLALGSWEVTPLELTNAYATFANEGVYNKAYGISRVLDRKGNVIYQNKPETREAIDPETASIMTWMLTGVVNSGSGQAAQIGRPVAGKTGTTDKARDLWFVGFVPQLVTGIWLGNDNNQHTWGASSSAAVVWRWYMMDIIKDISYQPFPPLPEKIEGRKPVIKKEPVKPRKSFYTMPVITEGAQVTPNRSTEERPSRRRKRGNTASVQDVSPTRTVTRRTRSYRSSEPTVGAPTRSVSIPITPAVEASIPIEVSPASDIAPPAPPAAYKTE
ncbi:transglycosylase domain-containing protein [Chroococcus sp. FPU101]|uniref:transglycosylase domain-containing protein n=1 Tax=Chroococcus sp. FPU101 TaxID=1974212 RepID=UPI001A8C2A24|nr:penicillin-binding protein 1A [Chroococcus sp. FPU101]GFE69171.1 penicillin-binding protein, 1A family [Chroococcus sp. FPU101]